MATSRRAASVSFHRKAKDQSLTTDGTLSLSLSFSSYCFSLVALHYKSLVAAFILFFTLWRGCMGRRIRASFVSLELSFIGFACLLFPEYSLLNSRMKSLLSVICPCLTEQNWSFSDRWAYSFCHLPDRFFSLVIGHSVCYRDEAISSADKWSQSNFSINSTRKNTN